MEDVNKIFDEYNVDCNSCESYWNNQCDAVNIGTVRNCTSYKATRNINVLEEIARLKSSIKSINFTGMLITIALLLHMLSEMVLKCLN